MILNFDIKDRVGLIADGTYFDLHNDFDLVQVHYDLVLNSVELRFRHCSGRSAARIVFGGLQRLELGDGFARAKGPRRVDEIGLKKADDNDLDWIMECTARETSDDMIIRFIDDSIVRVSAATAHFGHSAD